MSTVEETERAEPGLPRVLGVYPVEELDSGEPLHVDDAFGWIVECFGQAFLIRQDEDTGNCTFGSFRSTDRILHMFGRHDPLGALRPDAPIRWPRTLITDETDLPEEAAGHECNTPGEEGSDDRP